MLVKKFVPKALMQQNQQTTLVDDLCEVVGSVGYLLLDPTFSSTVANVSMERTLLRNFFFYHRNNMGLKERMIASKATVAVQEAFIRSEIIDVRGFGNKVAHSYVYGTSFQWVDIPNVKVEFHCNDGVNCLMINPSSSQLTKLQGHSFYLAELNQALSNEKLRLLSPSLEDNGWIYYQLLPLNYESRFDFTNSKLMIKDLALAQKGTLPLTKDLALKKLDHVLITARTGYGKTQLALAISAELGWLGNAILYFLDPKHSDLSSFGRFLGSRRYADTLEEIDTKLEELVKLMQKRYAIMRKMADKHPRRYVGASADQFGFKPIVIFFDEVSAYLASSKKGIKYLKKLLMLGRQASIFCVLILQDPRATNNLPSTIKDQTGIRIALGELNGTLAGLVFGSGIVLPDVPRGIGKGYIQVNGGEVQLFDAPMMPTDSANLYDLMKEALKNQQFLDPMKHN